MLQNGMFRGVCVDNRDPLNLGRIRVQVPQILGVAASGWAFPSWSIHETHVWPQDRLPKPGDGVWVMFDSTSPDKMIWVGAFGPLPLINQPGFAPELDFTSTLTLTMLDTPTWNTACRFTGTLGSDGGVPNPSPAKVNLAVRPVGGDWKVLATAEVDPTTGDWAAAPVLFPNGSIEYRAFFEGVGVYSPAVSDSIPFTAGDVKFPSHLTLLLNNTPELNKSCGFRGVLSNDWATPPGAKVYLNARPAGGAWQTVVPNILVNDATGEWTTNYTISIPGEVDYQAVFAGFDIYQPASSGILNTNTSVGTQVSTPVLPTLYNGTGFTVSGTVKVVGSSTVVNGGTVDLWWRYTTGGDTSWKQSSATAAVSAGQYSLTHPSLSILGPTEWQVRYVGTTQFESANSGSAAGTVNIRDAGAITKGTVTHTSVSFSWAAVPGASSYDVQRSVSSGAWTDISTGSASTSYTDSGLANSTGYSYRIRPRGTDVTGAARYGAYSAMVSAFTGRPAVAATTTETGWISVNATGYASHRIDTGWAVTDEARQGYFSTSYGGEGYIGIAKYGGSTIRDKIIAAIGSAAHAAGSCSAAQVTFNRSTTGTVGAATISFYTTPSTGTGSRPTLSGSAVNIAASGYSASKTYDIGTEHGNALGRAQSNSIAIARHDAASYLGLNGTGTLQLKWKYTTGGATYDPPRWI